MEKRINRRRWYRILLSPRFQLKYGAYYSAIALAALLYWNVIVIFMFVQLLRFADQVEPSWTLSQKVFAFVASYKWEMIASIGLTAVLFFALALVFSKNIAGPMRALIRHIEALKSGDYHHKTTLRKSDELKPLASGLNELSDSLLQRHGGAQAKPQG